jgi:hypothetical protein
MSNVQAWLARAALGAGFALGAPATHAQVFTQQTVVAACQSGDCAASIQAYARSLRAAGANAAEIDEAMTSLAIALGTAVKETSSRQTRSSIAEAIRTAAANVSDAAQRGALTGVAGMVINIDNLPRTAASAI